MRDIDSHYMTTMPTNTQLKNDLKMFHRRWRRTDLNWKAMAVI